MIFDLLSAPILLAALAAVPAAERPIALLAEPNGEGALIQVVAAGDRIHAAYDATYTLEVTSDLDSGGNRSVQRGRAHIAPGDTNLFISLRLGRVTPGNWEARLTVEPGDGAAYEEIRRSF